jgi:non-specific protein-tyrosine kinase
MELIQYIRILLKRWWLILLLTLVGSGAAVYNTLQEPPIYRSTATLLLNPALLPDSYVSGSFSYISYRAAELAQNYSLYLKTSAFAEKVIAEEGLNISPGALIDAISTRLIEGTQYFEITATRNDATEAQMLAMAIANNFIDAHMAQQQQQLALQRAAGDVDNMQALLREKLERERQYYEEQVTVHRLQIEQIETQPPSAARDELVAAVQARLSEYENRLLTIMSDQIELQPQGQNTQIDTVTIVQPAPLPESPIGTGKMQRILFALMASLVVGVTLAFGLEYLDYTVKGPDDLEALVGEPILGALSVVQETNTNREGIESIFVLAQPRSSISEAVRALRTNILFSQAGRELRSLIVTSAGPGEGKTTVAANLAVVMADAGKRVILVDADMRRPTLHKRFGVVNSVGLSSLMIADDPTDPRVLRRHLQQGPVETLLLLTSGPIPPNPAALLSSERAYQVLTALEAEADIVIYDTPPALTVTDAVILASRADATLQVVRAGVTRREIVLKTRATLQRVDANLMAPVINWVRAADIGHYGYYYAGYYGESDRKRPRSSHNGHAESVQTVER